jgi:hypothetical protein
MYLLERRITACGGAIVLTVIIKQIDQETNEP